VNDLLKRVKTDTSEVKEKVEILDHEKIIKRGPVYILHTLLSWVIQGKGENPLWITFRNRKSIKKLVCLFISNCNGDMINEGIKSGKLDALKNFMNPANHIDMHYNGFESSVE
jgi:hypothetical protein